MKRVKFKLGDIVIRKKDNKKFRIIAFCDTSVILISESILLDYSYISRDSLRREYMVENEEPEEGIWSRIKSFFGF